MEKVTYHLASLCAGQKIVIFTGNHLITTPSLQTAPSLPEDRSVTPAKAGVQEKIIFAAGEAPTY